MIARAWFAITALVVFTGLVVQLVVTARFVGGRFSSLDARLFNLFCYFTIQSNVIVGVTNLLLAVRPQRTSTLFRTLRLDGLVAIAVTGVVFHIALRGLQDLSGGAAFADLLLHTVSPVMCVAGWAFFGPHGTITKRVVALSVVFPLCWLAFTLVRGPIVDYYPYPFVDVTELGHVRVLFNCVLISVLFLALATGARAIDLARSRRALPPVRPEPPTAVR
jgi:hypothetical protein